MAPNLARGVSEARFYVDQGSGLLVQFVITIITVIIIHNISRIKVNLSLFEAPIVADNLHL